MIKNNEQNKESQNSSKQDTSKNNKNRIPVVLALLFLFALLEVLPAFYVLIAPHWKVELAPLVLILTFILQYILIRPQKAVQYSKELYKKRIIQTVLLIFGGYLATFLYVYIDWIMHGSLV